MNVTTKIEAPIVNRILNKEIIRSIFILELKAQRKDDYCYKSILKAVSGKYR